MSGHAQVIAELDRSPFSELRRYTATDITPAFGPNLLQMVGSPKLDFKVGLLLAPPPSPLTAQNVLHHAYLSDQQYLCTFAG